MDNSIRELQQDIVDEMTKQDETLSQTVIEALNETFKNIVRQRILENQRLHGSILSWKPQA
jgi:hypothetical protein